MIYAGGGPGGGPGGPGSNDHPRLLVPDYTNLIAMATEGGGGDNAGRVSCFLVFFFFLFFLSLSLSLSLRGLKVATAKAFAF